MSMKVFSQFPGALTRVAYQIMAISALVFSGVVVAAPPKVQDPYLRPELPPIPADNKLTPERVELGKQLFFDTRLSGSNWISCATCHNPVLNWTDGLPTAIGNGMVTLSRAAPTLVNVAFNKLQMWDGRLPTLEKQVFGPITSPGEMNQDPVELVNKLSAIKGYVEQFDKAYPGEGLTQETIGKALASFERTILSTESPFDRWRKGDKKAISPAAQRGFAVFSGKGNCTACHMGFNFSDDGFHNIGLRNLGKDEDTGRFAHRPVKISRGAFKTPTLRDIAMTAPYMHNGIYRTLEEVIEHYDRAGDVKDNLDPNLKPLNLSADEKAELVEFLKTLSGKPRKMDLPHIPHN